MSLTMTRADLQALENDPDGTGLSLDAEVRGAQYSTSTTTTVDAQQLRLRQQDYALVAIAATPLLACHLAYSAMFQRMAARQQGAPPVASV